jgi:hypothetical protein
MISLLAGMMRSRGGHMSTLETLNWLAGLLLLHTSWATTISKPGHYFHYFTNIVATNYSQIIEATYKRKS